MRQPTNSTKKQSSLVIAVFIALVLLYNTINLVRQYTLIDAAYVLVTLAALLIIASDLLPNLSTRRVVQRIGYVLLLPALGIGIVWLLH